MLKKSRPKCEGVLSQPLSSTFVSRLSDQATLELETLGNLLQTVKSLGRPRRLPVCNLQVGWLPSLWAPL